ncbi:MAG: hypothetical protein IJV35_01945 [Neisseriaceae bacterium]|nr:hypothetical protein [Neisseriaceae bacterium]
MKIQRDLIVFLVTIDIRDRKICELLGISKTTLYNYLKKSPISDEEKKIFSMDSGFYIGHFWEMILKIKSVQSETKSEYINNTIQQSFRLPENKVEIKKQERQKEKIDLTELDEILKINEDRIKENE